MKNDMLFKPVQGSSISENIALQIETAILNGKILPGERLSSQRDLQVMFQTGRGAVREAFRMLQQKGIIEVKKGVKGGAYVKKLEVTTASESMALLLKQRTISLKFLVEFRECIDRAVTTLAITRGEAAEKKELLEIAYQLQRVAGNGEPPDLEEVAEIDRNLNLFLSKMSKNPVFEWVMRTIQISFGSLDSILYEDPYYREKTVINWINTAKEILSGELLNTLSFIGYHYVLLQRCIKEKGINAVSQGEKGDDESDGRR